MKISKVVILFLTACFGPLVCISPATPVSTQTLNDFKALFHGVTIPTGAMNANSDEMLLRYRANDLYHEIIFLRAIAKLDLSAEQAGKILPSARKVRDMSEKRAQYLRDSWKAYAEQCYIVRDNNIMVITGCDRKQIEKITGEQWGFCPCPGYGIGRIDVAIREDFYKDVVGIEREVEAGIFTASQKEKLPAVDAEVACVELPVHIRPALWGGIKTKTGPVGALLLAPNAVAWLEKKAGQDSAASIKRAADFQRLGSEVHERYREMRNFDLRLVDGANVTAGFNFTEKQLTRLIDVLTGEVQKLHDLHSDMNKKTLRPMLLLLARIRDDVAAGKDLDEERLQEVLKYQAGICKGTHHRAGAALMYSMLCPKHKEFSDKLQAVFKRLEDGSMMDTAQCKLLYDTHQCDWLPPKNYRDPVRVGQTAKTIVYPGHAVMARLRSLSEADYAKERDAYAAEIVGGIVGANAGADARTAETKRAVDLLDKIRGMPDVAYELEKYNLLSQLLKKPCPEKTGGTGAEYANNGDPKELTWDTKFREPPYGWSIWDFMKAMEKEGKPLPFFSEKPISHGWSEWPVSVQEIPAKFLMDPAHVPALKTMLAIVRNPRKTTTNLDNLSREASNMETYIGE